jgi:3-isopropylmalate/(R)-2-methylmalate dehydratase small subunit
MANFAHRLRQRDHVSSDYILSIRYNSAVTDDKELVKYIFEPAEENFNKKVKQGDFIVAGADFGVGPARENASKALKAAGIRAIIAKGFSRDFYRSASNTGLCLVECETNYIDDMDELELDIEKSVLMNVSKGVRIEIKPIPKMMKKFLANGGVIQYFKQNRGFADLAENRETPSHA